MLSPMRVEPDWDQLVGCLPAQLQAEFRADSLRQLITSCYTRPGRHYHTLAHLAHCMSELSALLALPAVAEHLTAPRELAVALLFHDAVYDPLGEDSEEHSASLCSDAAPLFFPGLALSVVTRLIRLTSLHGRLPGRLTLSQQDRLFLDIDMSVLGAPAELYAAYREGVRREYEPLLGAVRYDLGRRAFLARLLESPQIYLSAHYLATREAEARANLREELEALGGAA
jgi:predicted metal-dependent HD superfamily phosphohydrolase